ncbi:MAG: hypothetical protein MHM6MM_009601 [Cercozoa sp. M6MM]
MTVENPKRPQSQIPDYDNVDMRHYEVFWERLDDLVAADAKTPRPLPPPGAWANSRPPRLQKISSTR